MFQIPENERVAMCEALELQALIRPIVEEYVTRKYDEGRRSAALKAITIRGFERPETVRRIQLSQMSACVQLDADEIV